ncbi:hypothetical protein K1T71_014075 [Dendrolimus kikuchii]|uniref:Uncharacterized protein n=1 Tax=Dendrolimus kikuchii TaxID=765133 RepID=A0ACC1CEZ0_9NEOP|nr:hypothetical protein K1T71_014075 [Dendrolimus kikuchii]
MSEGEGNIEGTDLQMLTAEYKDGQLQIVEVTPFDKGEVGEQSSNEVSHILPEMGYEEERSQPKYTVLESSKRLLELDLLNYTLVRCQDGEESYQFVESAEGAESNEASDDADTTVTCVLQTSDNETEQDAQESYVLVDDQNGQGPLVFLQSSLQQTNVPKKEEPKKKAMSYSEILEKAKALQKAKALVSKCQPTRAGRKRKGDLPSPHELLASPNFKLYLYSCKWCGFKCNAVKEMSAHKAAEHSNGNKQRVGSGRAQLVTLQCARCPFRGNTHLQLLKHVQDNHESYEHTVNQAIPLDTEEVEAADVLVCGACGFESSSRQLFRRHIEDVHGATTC